MAETEETRMEIGFAGGGVIHVTADAAQLEQLESALKLDDGGWVTITAKDDAKYLVQTGKVVFVRVQTLTRAIGFGK